MRVIFDGRPIRNPMSGVARYCLNLSNEMSRLIQGDDDLEIDVFCQNWRNSNTVLSSIKEDLRFTSVKCQEKIPSRLANLTFEFLPAISKQFYNGPYDIIHETYFANLGSKKSEKKVVTIHDVIPLEFPNYFNKRNSYFSRRNFFRQCSEADHIICVSEYTKSKILEFAEYDKPITVLPCGVETAPTDTLFSSRERLEQLFIDQDQINILYIGNIEPRKNLITLANAISTLNEKNKQYRLLIAGYSNFQADEIIESAKNTLGESVVYLGSVSDAEKWWLLENSNLFVLPSLYEGFGIPVIEAYAAGCIPVFSNCSSLSELAVLDSQLFDPKSIIDMAGVISRAVENDSLRNEIRSKANLKLDQYNWRKISSKVVEIYRSLG